MAEAKVCKDVGTLQNNYLPYTILVLILIMFQNTKLKLTGTKMYKILEKLEAVMNCDKNHFPFPTGVLGTK